MSPLCQTLLDAIVTLAAAFSGAICAFWLNDNAKARETEQQQVAAVNRAIFALVQQFNTLKVIQRQIIEPSRNDKAKFINMQPSLPITTQPPTMNFDELSFLLETEERNFLMEMMVEKERFETALQAMNERSRLHLEVLQPKMAAAEIVEGGDYTVNYITGVLGESFTFHIQRATEVAITRIDETIASNQDFTNRFHAAMKRLFPQHSIVFFEPKDPV